VGNGGSLMKVMRKCKGRKEESGFNGGGHEEGERLSKD